MSEPSKLTQKELKKLLSYDPLTGIFTWEIGISNRITIGSTAGSLDSLGYHRIGIYSKLYTAHRLAFLYVLGKFPKGQVDHKDHNRSNNIWDNLREVTHQDNSKNHTLRNTNTSGTTGVELRANGGWLARIMVDGKHIHLGVFDDIEDAIEARRKANIKYGFHKNHGK